MFCYKCGKESELTEGLCPECYSKSHHLFSFEKKYDVVICSNCDRYNLGEWKDFKVIEDIVEELVRRALGKRKALFTGELFEPSDLTIQVKYDMLMHEEYITINLEAHGFPDSYSSLPRTEKHSFIIFPKYTTCPRCSRKYGGYYEAVFQIRREGRFLTRQEIDDYIKEVDGISASELEKNKMAFITQVLKKKEGIDFQMGSLKFTKKLARALQKKYGGYVSESYRLTGFDRQEGKARYRASVVLRLSQLEDGNFILYDGGLWKISNSIGKVTLINFEESIALDFKKVEKELASGNLKMIDSKSLRGGMIVSIDETWSQVMFMDNYVTMELAGADIPKGARQGEKVEIYSEDGKYYISNP